MPSRNGIPTGIGGWCRQTKAGTSGRAPRARSIQPSWSGPRRPAGLPCTQLFAITRVTSGYSTR